MGDAPFLCSFVRERRC